MNDIARRARLSPPDDDNAPVARTRKSPRTAWQAKLFPGLVEPVEAAQRRPPPISFANPFRRPPRPRVEPGELPPAAAEWAAALPSAETRRAYLRDAKRFLRFAAIRTDGDMAAVERHDVERWRDHLQGRLDAGELAQATARRRMAAVASLFDHLNRRYLVMLNPAKGVRRPKRPALHPTSVAARKSLACRVAGCPFASTSSDVRHRPRLLPVLAEHGQLPLW